MNDVEILCRDISRNAAYLSNGMVIDLNMYNNNNSIMQLAELKQTEQQGIYAIVGTKNKTVIGYYNVATRTPSYLNNNQNNNNINTNNMLLNSNIQGGNSSFGDVAVGAVTLDSILNTDSNNYTTQTADVSTVKNSNTNTTPVVDEVLDFIDGYKFMPIPTTYSSIVIEKLSNTAAKWKIKVKQNEKENGMNNGKLNPHDEVYNELNATARKAVFEITESVDTSVLLFGPTSYAMAYMLSDATELDVTITSGEQYFGFYDSIDVINDVNSLKKNTDIIIDDVRKIALENKLITIARQSSNLHNWLRIASGQLTKIEKAAIKPYVVDLLIDYLTTIENKLTFSTTITNPFEFSTDYLLNLVMNNVDDMVLRNKYLNGFDLIYSRLVNIDNLKNYDILIPEVPESDNHRLLRVGGIGEVIPLVISKSSELDLELEKLINSDDEEIFKISDNTPNTLGLVKAIFNNTIKIKNKQFFNLTDYSTIGADMFLLLLDNNVLKVLKTDDSILIRKII